MALINCPHCGTQNDTKKHQSDDPDRIVKCSSCDFVFVTQAKVARIIRDGGGDAGDEDEPRTAISSGIATPVPSQGPAAPMVLELTATAGLDEGKSWTHQKPLVFIGRRNADVILEDQEASRQHAVIELHGDRFMLKDLGSTNGTYLDDAKVNAAEVKDGSQIRIGDTVLAVSIREA